MTMGHYLQLSAWRTEHQHHRAVEKCENAPTSVLRDNRIQQIPVMELVVGDLCFIESGNFLPADSLIVQANDLTVDESSITDVALFSGTEVKEGNGQMVVVGVGPNSTVGYVLSLLRASA
ncbi:unnamed protein product, partial [Rotaria sordida]